jgi:hypothetical protein
VHGSLRVEVKDRIISVNGDQAKLDGKVFKCPEGPYTLSVENNTLVVDGKILNTDHTDDHYTQQSRQSSGTTFFGDQFHVNGRRATKEEAENM